MTMQLPPTNMTTVIYADNLDQKNPQDDLLAMYRLRHQVFFQRLNWDVSSQELEIDRYDHYNPVVILARNYHGEVIACCRLLPTTGPYMLKDEFPELLQTQKAPENPHIWEISRFAVKHKTASGFQFGEMATRLFRAMVSFAIKQHIQQYVFATTLGLERLLQRLNIHYQRIAEPMLLGKERSVAARFYVDNITIEALHPIDSYQS